MKRFLILCALSLQQALIFGQSEDTIPSILEVAETFYSAYSTDSLGYPRVFFEKRPDGWFVVTKKIKDNKVIDDKRILFYDFHLKRFSSLAFPKSSKEIDNPIDYVDPFDRQFFDLYPYFGYTGWYKDVIAKLEPQEKLNDKELYALARAYSTFANSLLSDQFGFSIPEESFKPSLKFNCLTKEQIEKYQTICSRGISFFARLKKQNPLFETVVGNIAIKHANEIMVPFHCLMAYAPEYAQNIKLPDNIYPDSIIENAKKWMNSCPQNAIFLSFGDNDFYPLLYLQQHDRFRRDIYVLNYSLLGMGRYIYAYSQPLFEAKGIDLCVDSVIYLNEYNYYIYLNEGEKTFDIDQIISKFKSGKYQEVIELDGNTLSVNLIKSDLIKSPLQIMIEEKYIGMNQWILIDILNHLNNRPFILANGFNDQLKNLNSYLGLNGDVFRYPNF
ncbi:MAG TPA: hypothetical protein VJU78_00705 [Chitinophagaceae bacterium]|nr:hypothetical protein [Chitinophagaceae bacterium]